MKYTEKEKKAIIILDEFELRRKTVNYNRITVEDSRCAKIVLNLLEKQQKEIQKLERINKDYDLIYTKQYEYIQDSVSKETIRKKIEKLKDKEQEFTDGQGYWGSDKSLPLKIEVLEELLGDE